MGALEILFIIIIIIEDAREVTHVVLMSLENKSDRCWMKNMSHHNSCSSLCSPTWRYNMVSEETDMFQSENILMKRTHMKPEKSIDEQ